ncbi:LOB domain-containing protein 33-like [Cucurbita moschata]|uniref:LOB domain-containing protein 33-like n=1 Tax=Cucurbita moschata TaxID=3662 RepID=A0A6J1H1E9_CUCMO|nr:LOB domain-containing protein 33-like [Cucurbita moschata]
MTVLNSYDSSSSSSSSSCGACKFLRRKCSDQCVFAPLFSYDEATSHFAAVHKVFGASNVSKLLLHLPMHVRTQAAITVTYEALERMRDPANGCVLHIFALQQEVASLQEEIQILGTQIANLLTTGAAISAVENPFIEMNDFGMNSNHCQNELPSQLLPYRTSDDVQKDDQMISPLLCLGEKDGGFGFCHSNHVVETSGFDVSVEENFGGYPWILG